MGCWKKLGIPLIALAFTFTLGMFTTGCGGGIAAPASSTHTISGNGSKGPFVTGSSVTAYELTATGARTGNSVSTTTTDDLGSYSVTINWDGPTEIVITGNYFDELAGAVTTTPQTLSAIETLPASSAVTQNSVNPNIVTTVAARITKANGAANTAGIKAAKIDALTALGLPIFDAVGIAIDPAKLDLTNTDTTKTTLGDANAKLLLLSAALSDAVLNGNAAPSINTLLADFATDIVGGSTLGTTTGAGTATIIDASITTVSTAPNPTNISSNLNSRVTGAGGTANTSAAALTAVTTAVASNITTSPLKGFALSGNTFTADTGTTPQVWTIISDGTTTVTGTPATADNVAITGTLVDYTTMANPKSFVAAFSFAMKSAVAGNSSKATGTISPINVAVDGAGVVTVEVAAGAVLTFSSTSPAGATVTGFALNIRADNIITTTVGGVFTVDASQLFLRMRDTGNGGLSVLNVAGRFDFEFGFSGINVGHETGGVLDALFPATGTDVTGRVISGTIVTQ